MHRQIEMYKYYATTFKFHIFENTKIEVSGFQTVCCDSKNDQIIRSQEDDCLLFLRYKASQMAYIIKLTKILHKMSCRGRLVKGLALCQNNIKPCVQFSVNLIPLERKTDYSQSATHIPVRESLNINAMETTLAIITSLY